MAVRAVLFDFGGVIVRTEYQAPREHLAERLNMTYEDLCRLVFESETGRQASLGKVATEAHWRTVARRLSQPIAAIGSLREEFFAGDVLDRRLVEFISSLRPRCRTGLLSNAWPETRQYIEQNHLAEAFDVVVISSEVGLMKPDHAIYQLALKRLEVPAQEAVFVDDTEINVEAARELGIRGILFRSASQVQAELETLIR